MTTQYSSYFFSGLLQSGTRPPSPTTPTGPTHSHTPLSIHVPTPPSPSRARSTSGSNGAQQPRLRKRRSSMSVSAASPVGNVKSPIRSAGVAFQRQLLMSPTRSRSGSMNDAETPQEDEPTSFVGRLRSGSLRFPRRFGRKLGAAPNPPPMAPLPPIPGSAGPNDAPPPFDSLPPLSAPPLASAFDLSSNMADVPPRRPFAQRAHMSDNNHFGFGFGGGVDMAVDAPDASLMSRLGPSFAKMAMPSRLKTPPPTCPSSPPLPSSPMAMADSPIR